MALSVTVTVQGWLEPVTGELYTAGEHDEAVDAARIAGEQTGREAERDELTAEREAVEAQREKLQTQREQLAEARESLERQRQELADKRAAAGSASTSSADQTLARAAALVRSKGYEPVASAGFASGSTLQVIVGRVAESATGQPMWAFFFIDGQYIGTDTRVPSQSLGLTWAEESVVIIRYALYGPSDANCCPSDNTTVQFHWDGEKLEPRDPIPPKRNASGLGR